MARAKTTGPTERELDILTILWDLGTSSAREVHEALQKEITFSTVQTMLHVMFEKNYLSREKQGRGLVYQAIVKRPEIEQSMVGSLLERVFSGSAMNLVASALSAKPVSKQELAEIQKLLDDAKETLNDA